MNKIMLISHNWAACLKSCEGVIVVPDYEKMYKLMVNAAEDAIRILVEAQRSCEEMYIKAGEIQNKNEEIKVNN